VQAHGADAMVDEDNCVFFLPHHPRGEICEPPIFLFMKGTGALQIMNLALLSSANHYRQQNIHQSLFLRFSSDMHHT
jgi:hypothetical protein